MTAYLPSLGGGLLVGASAAVLLLVLGRIAGISGIAGGLLRAGAGERLWRTCFLGGLLAGGATLHAFRPDIVAFDLDRSSATIVLAGVLVGFGTRLGNGCTSGHGVCGVARGSRRSIVATLIFVVAGMATVLVTRWIWWTI